MALSKTDVEKLAEQLMEKRQSEKPRLDRILGYRRDGIEAGGVFSPIRLAGIPAGSPSEVKALASISRVNLIRYVVSARVQNMYVDGFQTTDSADNVAGWDIWQANAMDARQIGVHRAALTFGAAYVVVLPGDPVPVLRGVSPRDMTVAYGDDDVWPVAALERRRGSWRAALEASDRPTACGSAPGRPGCRAWRRCRRPTDRRPRARRSRSSCPALRRGW